MDIFEGGSGQLDIAGQVYDVHRDNDGRNWVADHLEGDAETRSFTASSPAELARKVADHHGVTGPVSIQDERPGGRATQRFEHTAKSRKAAASRALPDPVSTEMRERLAHFTPAEREQLRAAAQELRTARGETPASAWRAVIEGAEQDRLTGIGAFSRRTPGTGPGNVAVGGTDADRRAARPRMEGESDRAYEVRTAPSRDAALRILQGNSAAGLRSIARGEGVVTSGSKADLVARLIRVMRDRHEDSAAIERMVNRDRQTQPPATVTAATTAPPRTNAPASTGPITPTMTGAQLLAARRAARG